MLARRGFAFVPVILAHWAGLAVCLNRAAGISRMRSTTLTVVAVPLALMALCGALRAANRNVLASPARVERNTSRSDTMTRQFVLGGRPFSPTSSWNTPIPPTATYSRLDWPRGPRYGVAWKSYSPAIHASSDSDPMVKVDYPPSWGYPGGAVKLRIPPDADGADGTDGELLVIDQAIVHNFWQFKRLGPTTATAKSYAAAEVLTGTGWGRSAPFRGAGIVATGSSQLAGLLVQAETDRGEIAHALQLCIESSLAKPGHTGEAINGDGAAPNGIAQQGERLAIPPETPVPNGLSPLGHKVFRAYQKYGVFVVDVAGGVTNLRAQANAYDVATIRALQADLPKITPLLQRVRY